VASRLQEQLETKRRFWCSRVVLVVSRGLIPRVALHAIFNACQRPGAMGVLPMALGFLIQRQKGVSRRPFYAQLVPIGAIYCHA